MASSLPYFIFILFVISCASQDAHASTESANVAFPAIVVGSRYFNANVTLIDSNLPIYNAEWNSSFTVTCPDEPTPIESAFSCSHRSSFIETTPLPKFICLFDIDISKYDGCVAYLSLNTSSGVTLRTSPLPILSPVVVAPMAVNSLPFYEEESVTITIPTISGLPPKCRRATFFVQLQAAHWGSLSGPFTDLAVCFARPKSCSDDNTELLCDVHVDLAQFYPLQHGMHIRASILRDRILNTGPDPSHSHLVAIFVPARPNALPSSTFELTSRSSALISIRMRSPSLPPQVSRYRFGFSALAPVHCPTISPPIIFGPVFESDILRVDLNLTSLFNYIHACSLSLRIESNGIFWKDVTRFFRAPILESAISNPAIHGTLIAPASAEDGAKEIPFETSVLIRGQFMAGYDPSLVRLQVRGSGPWNWCKSNNFASAFKASNVSALRNYARFPVTLGSGFYGCSLFGYVSINGLSSENSVPLGRLAVTATDLPALRFLITIRCQQCSSEVSSHPNEHQLRYIKAWVAGVFLPNINATSVNSIFLSSTNVNDMVTWMFRLDLLDDAAANSCNVRLQQQSLQRPLRDSVPPLNIDGVVWKPEQANFACVPLSFYGIYTANQAETSVGSMTLIIILSAVAIVVFAFFSFGILICRMRERAYLSLFNLDSRGVHDDAASADDAEEPEPLPTMIFADGKIPGIAADVIMKRSVEECSICLEEKSNACVHPCDHWFCEDCAARIRSCALCRAPIERISVLQREDSSDSEIEGDPKPTDGDQLIEMSSMENQDDISDDDSAAVDDENATLLDHK
eukprot:TRINITY_DN9830_c0_g1_i1.p1 TRINITY_DN9830_c0_g1~~TRINITY_DN9830_c0_g1_i1.p1  ORF type:complete len:803 (+),score=79.74 TRINITY_DN9830_c0_g1_i1:113-2521(+)